MYFNTKKVLIFDLDGTLIDSALDLAVSINHMLQTLELPTFDESLIHTWVGNGAKTLVERALSGSIHTNPLLEEIYVMRALDIFLTYYKNHLCVKTITYPHVSSTLKKLKHRGYKLMIVTNKPHQLVLPILQNLRIDTYFDTILGGDSLLEKKPHPMPLLHIAKHSKVDIVDCLMIGDSKNDILAAKACHMQSIGVTYGYNYGESISTYKPTHLINNFSELLEVLDA